MEQNGTQRQLFTEATVGPVRASQARGPGLVAYPQAAPNATVESVVAVLRLPNGSRWQ
jgi:hypothetical protein